SGVSHGATLHPGSDSPSRHRSHVDGTETGAFEDHPDLHATAHAELREHLLEVGLHRAAGDVQRYADLLVRAARGDADGDVALPLGECGHTLLRRSAAGAALALDHPTHELRRTATRDDGLAPGRAED